MGRVILLAKALVMDVVRALERALGMYLLPAGIQNLHSKHYLQALSSEVQQMSASMLALRLSIQVTHLSVHWGTHPFLHWGTHPFLH